MAGYKNRRIQSNGNAINQHNIETLKRMTEKGYLMILDPSAMPYSRDDQFLEARKQDNPSQGLSNFLSALASLITKKEINFYMTFEGANELELLVRRVGKSTDPVKVKLGHSANRFLTALSSERCLFDPYSTYSNPYLDPLKFHNPILMGFIQEVINDHPDVKSRRISQTDIGFCVASLYLSLAPHNHKIVALHSDSDIEILEEWFLKGYYRYLYGHFKEKELPEDLFYRIRSRLTHITPGRGRLTTIPVLALTRPAQKNTHYMLNARNA